MTGVQQSEYWRDTVGVLAWHSRSTGVTHKLTWLLMECLSNLSSWVTMCFTSSLLLYLNICLDKTLSRSLSELCRSDNWTNVFWTSHAALFGGMTLWHPWAGGVFLWHPWAGGVSLWHPWAGELSLWHPRAGELSLWEPSTSKWPLFSPALSFRDKSTEDILLGAPPACLCSRSVSLVCSDWK